ncbi:MAG TPA: hypothetical protein VKI40_06825, partial [Terriglobales bacterium]|nr:hypothetical protein [Terriglobales bacterium]
SFAHEFVPFLYRRPKIDDMSLTASGKRMKPIGSAVTILESCLHQRLEFSPAWLTQLFCLWHNSGKHCPKDRTKGRQHRHWEFTISVLPYDARLACAPDPTQ